MPEIARYLVVLKKVGAGAPPRPHDDRTREHLEQCVECQEWNRAMNASLEKIEKEEGMISGELGALLLMTRATKANALAGPPPHAHVASQERQQCPECQEWDKTLGAAYEKLSNVPPEELLAGEPIFNPEWFTNMKAKMVSLEDAFKEAIKRDDLLLPPEHLRTHKSHEESLACYICQDWIRRRDAIFKEAFRSRFTDST